MKPNYLFCLLAFLFFKSNTWAQGSLSVGMVMYLPFNGNTLDISGAGNHAINSGAVLTSGVAGLPNTAYYFNGAVHMTVKHHMDLNPKRFSVCAKVKVQGFYNGFCYNNIIMTKGLQRTPGFYSLMHSHTQVWDCTVEDITKHNYRHDVQNITIPVSDMETLPYIVKDNWDCIVGTFDGDTAKMYVNGVLRYKYYEPGFSSNTNDIFIGKMNAPAYPFFLTGSIDEMRIYNRALSATEVYNYCAFSAPSNTIVANFKDSNISCISKQFIDLTTFSSTPIKFWNWDFGDGTKSTLQFPNHTFSAPGTYNVKLVVIDSNGYSDSIVKSVVVGNYRFAKAGNDTTVCRKGDGNAKIQLNAGGGVSYLWSPTSGLSDSAIANPIATLASSKTYVVTVTDANGCVDKDTIKITIKQGEVNVIATPKNISGCTGIEVQLNATGAKEYLWQPNIGLDNEKIHNPKVTLLGVNTYTVIGTDSNGCADIDTVTVNTFPRPNVRATSDNSSVDCIEKSALLTSSGALSYQWTPAVFCETPNAALTLARPPATTVFTVIGIDANGCAGSDTITVFYDGKTVVKVPNAFTPNNDGINDIIRPIIVCDFILLEFTIYNRWGSRMFTTKDFNKGWDGIYEGQECDLGVYYYFIKGKNSKNEEVLLKGDITLVR